MVAFVLTAQLSALIVDDATVRQARQVIDGLPRTLDAVAVVEFAAPMSTERLVAFNRRHKACGGADVSYVTSRRTTTIPVSRPE